MSFGNPQIISSAGSSTAPSPPAPPPETPMAGQTTVTFDGVHVFTSFTVNFPAPLNLTTQNIQITCQTIGGTGAGKILIANVIGVTANGFQVLINTFDNTVPANNSQAVIYWKVQ